jgi:hypothetical protein
MLGKPLVQWLHASSASGASWQYLQANWWWFCARACCWQHVRDNDTRLAAGSCRPTLRHANFELQHANLIVDGTQWVYTVDFRHQQGPGHATCASLTQFGLPTSPEYGQLMPQITCTKLVMTEILLITISTGASPLQPNDAEGTDVRNDRRATRRHDPVIQHIHSCRRSSMRFCPHTAHRWECKVCTPPDRHNVAVSPLHGTCPSSPLQQPGNRAAAGTTQQQV